MSLSTLTNHINIMSTTTTATTIAQEGSTKTEKNYHGWKTESYFKIEGGPNSGRYVKVYTSKGSSGRMTSHAKVITMDKDGNESWIMFGDPSIWLNKGEVVRATEKTCAEQHGRALKTLLEMSTDWVNGEK